jgi:fatty-acyl-CoA synthase
MALAAHPSINDVVVTSRPSERWGQEVVAIVALADGSPTADDLIDHAARSIARYKLPKAIILRPSIMRSPSGKADYRWAKQQAVTP